MEYEKPDPLRQFQKYHRVGLGQEEFKEVDVDPFAVASGKKKRGGNLILTQFKEVDVDPFAVASGKKKRGGNPLRLRVTVLL
jgi:hypothetical protein